jgi:acetyltransferase-like isoleucine patch superfamily enzyme
MGKLIYSIKSVLREIVDFIEFILRDFPGKTGCLLRWGYYKCRMKHLGRKVIIESGCRFSGCKYISIGEKSTITYGCAFVAGPVNTEEAGREYLVRPNPHFTHQPGEIIIGKCVYISRNCCIIGNGGIQIDDYCCCSMDNNIISMSNHYSSFKDPGNRSIYFTHRAGSEHECYLLSPIVLKRNVGVATRCVLLPGATILEDSFIGVGSVVYREIIGPNQIASGNPAIFIKNRYTE